MSAPTEDPEPTRDSTPTPSPTPNATPTPRLAKSAVAIALLFGYGVLAAVLAGMPLTEVVRVFYGGHPNGDAPLAEPGALALGDLVLGRGAASFSAALPTSVVLVVLGAIGAHLPFGALLAHLAKQGQGTLRDAYARSASRFFVMGSATLVSLAARAVTVIAAVALASMVAEATHGKLDDRASDLVGLATLLPFGLVLFVLFVLTDLTYVGIVAHGTSLPRAILHAGRTLRAQGRAAWIPALLAYGGGLAAVAVVGSTTGFFAISAAPATLFLAHQAALLTKLVLRASWLTLAIPFPGPKGSAADVIPKGPESA